MSGLSMIGLSWDISRRFLNKSLFRTVAPYREICRLCFRTGSRITILTAIGTIWRSPSENLNHKQRSDWLLDMSFSWPEKRRLFHGGTLNENSSSWESAPHNSRITTAIWQEALDGNQSQTDRGSHNEIRISRSERCENNSMDHCLLHSTYFPFAASISPICWSTPEKSPPHFQHSFRSEFLGLPKKVYLLTRIAVLGGDC
jgi:hypothetical protein